MMILVFRRLFCANSEYLDHIGELAELALPPPHVVRVCQGDRGGTLEVWPWADNHHHAASTEFLYRLQWIGESMLVWHFRIHIHKYKYIFQNFIKLKNIIFNPSYPLTDLPPRALQDRKIKPNSWCLLRIKVVFKEKLIKQNKIIKIMEAGRCAASWTELTELTVMTDNECQWQLRNSIFIFSILLDFDSAVVIQNDSWRLKELLTFLTQTFFRLFLYCYRK